MRKIGLSFKLISFFYGDLKYDELNLLNNQLKLFELNFLASPILKVFSPKLKQTEIKNKLLLSQSHESFSLEWKPNNYFCYVNPLFENDNIFNNCKNVKSFNHFMIELPISFLPCMELFLKESLKSSLNIIVFEFENKKINLISHNAFSNILKSEINFSDDILFQDIKNYLSYYQ